MGSRESALYTAYLLPHHGETKLWEETAITVPTKVCSWPRQLAPGEEGGATESSFTGTRAK